MEARTRQQQAALSNKQANSIPLKTFFVLDQTDAKFKDQTILFQRQQFSQRSMEAPTRQQQAAVSNKHSFKNRKSSAAKTCLNRDDNNQKC